MIKPINRDVNILKQTAAPAGSLDLDTARDLSATLLAHRDNCVGMAANMIGVPKAIIAILVGPLPMVMLNPKILKQSGKYQTEEGCLSLSGQRPTTRFQKITVQYQDLNLKPHTQSFSDFTAEIIQHECDHLQGTLI